MGVAVMNPVGKRCTACGKTKPLTDFFLHPKGRDGRQARCKPCHSAMANKRQNEEAAATRVKWMRIARAAARQL